MIEVGGGAQNLRMEHRRSPVALPGQLMAGIPTAAAKWALTKVYLAPLRRILGSLLNF